jgi:dTDP-4-dehydrorhamnose reductase
LVFFFASGAGARIRGWNFGAIGRPFMAIFVTGATGYLGSYLVAGLLTGYREPLNLLVRAKSDQEARERLWQSLQLHLGFPEFFEYLNSRITIFRGELTSDRFGLADDKYHALVDTTNSLIHCAASLNRKSEKQCMNVNLRGGLEVIQLARRAQNRHGVLRYSHVSTVAVAGKRQNEVVKEDEAIDWSRSDYDPYARTKKFGEHMVHQLLPDVPRTIFRPAIVMGDSRRAETSQFDMVQAFDTLARLPLFGIYHLSAGTGSPTYREITTALASAGGGMKPKYLPSLGKTFSKTVDRLSRRNSSLGRGASLLKVFWPYLDWNTVFDNARVVSEMGGVAPAKFTSYAYPLLKFSRENKFRYPAKPWPSNSKAAPAAGNPVVAGSAHA